MIAKKLFSKVQMMIDSGNGSYDNDDPSYSFKIVKTKQTTFQHSVDHEL